MEVNNTYYAAYKSPLGLIHVAMKDGAVTDIVIRPDTPRMRGAVEDKRVFAALFDLFDRYFAGEAVGFEVPLALAGTPFELDVWTALRTIPWGATASYGQVAVMVGRPKACRAVGAACGANPLPLIIPCHRVLRADGAIGGYSGGGGVDFKRSLLLLEGIA